jgi:hypothetical protein
MRWFDAIEDYKSESTRRGISLDLETREKKVVVQWMFAAWCHQIAYNSLTHQMDLWIWFFTQKTIFFSLSLSLTHIFIDLYLLTLILNKFYKDHLMTLTVSLLFSILITSLIFVNKLRLITKKKSSLIVLLFSSQHFRIDRFFLFISFSSMLFDHSLKAQAAFKARNVKFKS